MENRVKNLRVLVLSLVALIALGLWNLYKQDELLERYESVLITQEQRISELESTNKELNSWFVEGTCLPKLPFMDEVGI